MPPSTSSSSTGTFQGKPLYTTAGTIYNPSTATPIQPPNRRGRSHRWPPPCPADVAWFLKRVAPAQPYSNHPPASSHNCPPPASSHACPPPASSHTCPTRPYAYGRPAPVYNTSSTMDYSPLQQNSHHAVQLPAAPAYLNRAVQSPAAPAYLNRSNAESRLPVQSDSLQPIGTKAGFHKKVSYVKKKKAHSKKKKVSSDKKKVGLDENKAGPDKNKAVTGKNKAGTGGNKASMNGNKASMNGNKGHGRNMGFQFKNKEEEELARMITTFGIPALSSVAAYPNPNQQKAQKALDKAQEAIKVIEDAYPVYYPRSFHHSAEGGSTLPPPKSLTPDYGGAIWGSPLTTHVSGPNGSTHVFGPTGTGVLSRGPGAPPPLTAGPPGQRHYSVEAAFLAVQSINKPPSSAIDEAHFDIDPYAFVNMGRQPPMEWPSPPLTPDQRGQQLAKSALEHKSPRFVALGSKPLGRPDPAKRTSQTKDSLPVEPLRQYFPKGLPPDYYYDPDLASAMPSGLDHLELKQGQCLPSPETMRQEMDRCKAAFYASDGELFKSFDNRLTEARNKLEDMELTGAAARERASYRLAQAKASVDQSKLGKPNEDFKIEFVNSLPTHEAATPLINRAFKTMANYLDNSRLMKHDVCLRENTMTGSGLGRPKVGCLVPPPPKR